MPLAQDKVEQLFGRFEWRDDPERRGRVVIGGDWFVHNITRIKPPFRLMDGNGRPIAQIACHARIADQLQAVFVELKDDALGHLINTFDGCWVPRHMNWDPARSLSHHSWGIAVDVNARLFPYGSHDVQHSQLIAAFRRHGFEWGGYWRVPDPMHFEVAMLSAVVSDLQGMKIVVDDKLVSRAGRLIGGVAEGPLEPVVEALGATLTAHPEQQKLYIYSRRIKPGR